jgi:hypothetical protein
MVKLSFPACPPTLGTRPYENVCKSKGVPRTEKTAYLRALTVCGKDLSCAKKTHEKHRHGKARTGPKANDLDPRSSMKWSSISKLLGRSASSCRQPYSRAPMKLSNNHCDACSEFAVLKSQLLAQSVICCPPHLDRFWRGSGHQLRLVAPPDLILRVHALLRQRLAARLRQERSRHEAEDIDRRDHHRGPAEAAEIRDQPARDQRTGP